MKGTDMQFTLNCSQDSAKTVQGQQMGYIFNIYGARPRRKPQLQKYIYSINNYWTNKDSNVNPNSK